MGKKQRISILRKRMNHTIGRFIERHGIYISNKDYYDICQQIFNNESTFLIRVSNRYTIHRIYFNGEQFPVVYSNKHHQIVTVYQNKWIKKRKDGTYFLMDRNRLKKPKKPKKLRVPYQLKNKRHKENFDEWSIF